MLRYLWLEGKITCTLIQLNGIHRGEEKSTTFSGTHPDFDLLFSRGERFNFSLRVKHEEKPNKLTGFNETSRSGQLDFSVFQPGIQRASYNGGTTFNLELNKEECRLKLDPVFIIKGFGGGVGTVKIELFLKASG